MMMMMSPAKQAATIIGTTFLRGRLLITSFSHIRATKKQHRDFAMNNGDFFVGCLT